MRASGFPNMPNRRENELEPKKRLANHRALSYQFPSNDVICLWAVPIFAGVHREEGIPDPIPNSAVKLFIAHDTAYFCVGK